jgi:hypothetical protein
LANALLVPEIFMTVKRTSLDITQPITVVQPDPLGLPEQRMVSTLLEELAPEWCVELEGICADEATLVVVPQSGDDATGPSFVISRGAFGYRLDQVHWEEMREVGLFPSLDDVMAAVLHMLTLDAAHFPRHAPTIH